MLSKAFLPSICADLNAFQNHWGIKSRDRLASHQNIAYYTYCTYHTTYATPHHTTLHTLHCTTLYYTTQTAHTIHTTLHHTTLHCTTLHYTTLHTLHYTTLYYTTHTAHTIYTTLHHTILHYTSTHYTTYYITHTVRYATLWLLKSLVNAGLSQRPNCQQNGAQRAESSVWWQLFLIVLIL